MVDIDILPLHQQIWYSEWRKMFIGPNQKIYNNLVNSGKCNILNRKHINLGVTALKETYETRDKLREESIFWEVEKRELFRKIYGL